MLPLMYILNEKVVITKSDQSHKYDKEYKFETRANTDP